jgi:hypothetical protein
MAKREARILPKGELLIPFEPFYRSPLPIGTLCEIVEDEGERYIVKFDNKTVVGHSGTYHIQKHYVKEIINDENDDKQSSEV